MKKTILAFAAIVMSCCQAQATLLEIWENGWTNPSARNYQYNGCDNSIAERQKFKVVMNYEADHYLYQSQVSTTWDIKVELFDKTSNTSLGVIEYPNQPAYTPLYDDNTQSLYQKLTYWGNNRAEVDFSSSNPYLTFYFENIAVVAGHQYEAEIHLKHRGVLNIVFHTEPTEYTNRITINGSPDFTANTWNRRTVQPSFTKVSTGDIAGNPNNEGYLISNDNMVYNVVHSNNQWNIWALSNTFTQAAPGAITVNPNNGEVYFIGTDGRVYNAVWANNQWNIWAISNTFTNAAPGAITVNPNNGQVYFIGTDGRVYNCVWTNNQWNIWALSNSFTNAAPGAITVNRNNGEVYIIGTDGRVYNCVWSNNQWNIWAISNSFTNAAPGAISANPGNGEVYFIGTDGRVYSCVWANNQWNIWSLTGNYTSAAAGAIVVQPDNGHVYYINNEHRLCNAVWTNNQWNMWTVDNNHYAEYGTIGVHTKYIGNQLHDIVHTKNSANNLVQHIWMSCTSNNTFDGNAGSMMTADTKVADAPTSVNNSFTYTNKLSVAPNPIDNFASVTYELGIPATVSVSMYDMMGRKVLDIANEQKDAGRYTYRIEKNNLQAGIYYLVMNTDASQEKIVERVIIR